jgi:hypothetical protein
MKQVGVIVLLMLLAGGAALMVGRLATPTYYSPGALRMESYTAELADQARERFPATQPDSDVAWYVALPTTRP